ncbi:MAG: aryl-sulfate sulfotransferase [Gemmataceae bacterium]|nr:aryl-sulfate sulfotransferase [Gemmataceae bacterium]
MNPRVRRLARFGAKLGLALVLLALATAAGGGRGMAQPPKGGQPGGRPVGVTVNDAKALKGYTLVAALNSTKAHLIDMDGRVVKTWETGVTPGASTYLLENGHLLRTGSLGAKNKINGAAVGGRVLEFDWNGEVVWDFTFATEKSQPHHDICKMPNGNVLLIVWDKKTEEEAIAAGRRPDVAKGGVLADAIIEVKPTGKTTGEIVWEWRAWDRLVQDFDKTKANYGNVAQKAELIDLNFGSGALARMVANKDDLQKLKDLGYVGGGQPQPKDPKGGPGGGPGSPFGFSPDWLHTNSVAYNAELDQIVLSVHEFHEVWVIDHSTTTKEAAGHTGGKSGKGGDLLYRWGNPKAYRAGTNADQKLFGQHNAHWIPNGLPGAGNLIVFNNGMGRPGGAHSSVDEIALPVEKDGKYTRKAGQPFGPDKATWSFSTEKKTDFFAMLISGAHRLPNGNTLVCSGPDGTVFEVTADKQTVWKFTNPARGGGGGGGFGMFAFPRPGEVMNGFMQDQLKLTAEQKKQLDDIQKDVDAKLEKLLTEEQRKQLKDMQAGPFGGPGGGFGGGPGGPGGGFGGGFGGPGGLFRAYRFAEDFPGFKGKELKPGKKLEEMDGKN